MTNRLSHGAPWDFNSTSRLSVPKGQSEPLALTGCRKCLQWLTNAAGFSRPFAGSHRRDGLLKSARGPSCDTRRASRPELPGRGQRLQAASPASFDSIEDEARRRAARSRFRQRPNVHSSQSPWLALFSFPDGELIQAVRGLQSQEQAPSFAPSLGLDLASGSHSSYTVGRREILNPSLLNKEGGESWKRSKSWLS